MILDGLVMIKFVPDLFVALGKLGLPRSLLGSLARQCRLIHLCLHSVPHQLLPYVGELGPERQNLLA